MPVNLGFRALRPLVLLVLAVLLLSTALDLYAHAANYSTPSAVARSIPYGDWIAAILSWAQFILVSLVLWAIQRYVPAVIRVFLTKDAVTSAVNAALSSVEGAVAGKTLTVAQTNEVLDAAVDYLVEHEPQIARWVGDALRLKVAALLQSLGSVPAEANAKSLYL
jgi:hypothetical protein